jgi:hypothetical protein
MSMPRRAALSAIAGLASSFVPPALRAQKDSGGSALTVDINLGDDRPDPALAILRSVDAKNIDQVKERGLGGVETVVACVLAAKGLASAIVKLLPTSQCGMVVDMRPARVSAKKNCDIQLGTVVVIRADGMRREFKQALFTPDSDVRIFLSSFHNGSPWRSDTDAQRPNVCSTHCYRRDRKTFGSMATILLSEHPGRWGGLNWSMQHWLAVY